MGDQLKGLLEIFHRVEAEGGQATLSVTTHGGKTKLKLEIVSPPSETAPPSSPPAPGRRRRRRRGAAARALAKQRAAAHQATLAEAATSDPLVPSSPSSPHIPHTTAPRPPLHHLLSPSPLSGRRRVMSLGRPAEMTSFASLNLDGHCSKSSPPLPPPPPTPPPLPMAHDILETLQRFDSVGEVSCEECFERLYSIFYSSTKSPDDDGCAHHHDHFPGEKVLWKGKWKDTGIERLYRCGGPPPSKLPILP